MHLVLDQGTPALSWLARVKRLLIIRAFHESSMNEVATDTMLLIYTSVVRTGVYSKEAFWMANYSVHLVLLAKQ